MVRLFVPISLVVAFVAMACAGSSSMPGSAAPAATSAPAAAPPTTTAAQSTTSGWTRPMDVTPLTELPSAATSVGGKAPSGLPGHLADALARQQGARLLLRRSGLTLLRR